MDDILYSLTTEQVNDKSSNIDMVSTKDILKIMNDEDKKVAYAVEQRLSEIALAIDRIVERMKKGGRLMYFGAGTSGRLGVLDAAECPPTFGTPVDMVQGVMAGGDNAFNLAKEDVEDFLDEGIKDATNRNVCMNDVVIGLSASGRTPYVIGVLSEARKRGALTVSISCNQNALVDNIAEININVVVGPEIIMGSTRLKAGTAQKMVLNMISTVTMIKLGKVYKNLMVDVKPKNIKLTERAKRIIMLATSVSYETAEKYLSLSNGDVKAAVVMIECDTDYDTASALLNEAGGVVSRAIQTVKRK